MLRNRNISTSQKSPFLRACPDKSGGQGDEIKIHRTLKRVRGMLKKGICFVFGSKAWEVVRTKHSLDFLVLFGQAKTNMKKQNSSYFVHNTFYFITLLFTVILPCSTVGKAKVEPWLSQGRADPM
jgi:hypothetical protein